MSATVEAEVPDVFEWYSYAPIMSRSALWSIVAGPRSIGKTYGAKRDAVGRFISNGEQTIWVRRSLTELRPAKSGFFDSIAPLYPGFEFRVEGGAGQVKIDGREWVTLIRFVALSTAAQYKGTEFPLATWIVYDECFVEPGFQKLEDEVRMLRGFWITVNRGRTARSGKAKTRVLLLGNVYELDNPWFLEWDFNGDDEWQKGRMTRGDVILHLVDASRYVKRVTKSIYGNVLGTQDTDYADGSYFRPDGGYMIDERPGDSKPYATLVTLRGVFGLWVANDHSKMFVTAGPLLSDSGLIALEPMAVQPGVMLVDNRSTAKREIRRQYRRGTMFFVGARAMAARQAIAR